jgi:16S rRNA C1402 (ribose-2'-O) methylase RsmI
MTSNTYMIDKKYTKNKTDHHDITEILLKYHKTNKTNNMKQVCHILNNFSKLPFEIKYNLMISFY